ncbi:MAG: hypothetical protein E7117_00195 [Bacteroidales bacterium]|nr:hypothetical protein [Bacteroidales bacterium]
MKRILTIAAVLFGFTVAAVAQPRAIGAHFGWTEAASYQHTVGSNNFIELSFGYTAGLPHVETFTYTYMQGNFNPDAYYAAAMNAAKKAVNKSAGTLRLTGTYNFMILQPEWTSKGEWGFYAGPGVTLGTGFNYWKAFSVGIAGQVGLEYTFWFPLKLSVDLRPTIGLMVQDGGVVFDKDGIMGFIPSISARYTF